MGSSAVDQAVTILRDRHQEAVKIRDELTAEIATISDALDRLGYAVETPRPDLAYASEGEWVTIEAKFSIRAAVQEKLDAAPAGLTNDDLVRVLATMQGSRDAGSFRAAIRTAVWQLRQNKVAITQDGRHFSTKWRTNADGPAVTGPSDQEALVKEGGEANGQANHGDHPLQGWNDSHHRDPALLGLNPRAGGGS